MLPYLVLFLLLRAENIAYQYWCIAIKVIGYLDLPELSAVVKNQVWNYSYS